MKSLIHNSQFIIDYSTKATTQMTTLPPYQFTHDMAVRDYECDAARMVNNSVYLNYLEHARHLFLRQQGIDFQAWVDKGIALVVIRIEIDYLWSLRSGDQFRIGINTERISRLRFGMLQDVYRLPDLKEYVKDYYVNLDFKK